MRTTSENEVWNPITEYVSMYEVSNMGRVRSMKRIVKHKSKSGIIHDMNVTGKILKLIKINSGYLTVGLAKDGKAKRYLVHRLVATAFIPQKQGYDFVNHKNENKEDNRSSNLEWTSFVENIRYGTGVKRSHANRGYNWFHEHKRDKNPAAKVIIQYSKSGEKLKEWGCVKDAADSLGITSSTICCALKGKAKTAKGYIWKYK